MEFICIAAAHFLALLSPGPDFFLLMRSSLTCPLGYGIAVSGGIALGNGLYIALATLGLELFGRYPGLALGLRYLGAAYLLLIGALLLTSQRREDFTPQKTGGADAPDSGKPGPVRNQGAKIVGSSLVASFAMGLLSALLNPKNALFYLALFTAMVDVSTTLTMRAFYGLWMMAVVFCWDCLVVACLGHRTVKAHLGTSIFLIEKLAGVMLAGFGLMLPFS